jgi:hypothetical protein
MVFEMVEEAAIESPSSISLRKKRAEFYRSNRLFVYMQI